MKNNDYDDNALYNLTKYGRYRLKVLGQLRKRLKIFQKLNLPLM